MLFKKIDNEERQLRKQREELIDTTVCFTGHRPDKLYVENRSDAYDLKGERIKQIKTLLLAEIERQIELGKNRFISGGALGIDMLAWLCVNYLKKEKYSNIQNTLAIPFEKQYIKWSDKNQKWHHQMKELSDKIVYTDLLDDYRIEGYAEGIYYPAKMQKRNEYMVDNSSVVIACWDGSKGGTGNCVNYAKRKGKEITRIDSKTMEVYYNIQHL